MFKSQIEPSGKGSLVIADIIDYVAKNHDFNGESKFYIKKGLEAQVECELNVEGYKWDISNWDFSKN